MRAGKKPPFLDDKFCQDLLYSTLTYLSIQPTAKKKHSATRPKQRFQTNASSKAPRFPTSIPCKSGKRTTLHFPNSFERQEPEPLAHRILSRERERIWKSRLRSSSEILRRGDLRFAVRIAGDKYHAARERSSYRLQKIRSDGKGARLANLRARPKES